MTVKYYDKSAGEVVELTSVTKLEPIVNGSKLALSHLTTPLVILTSNFIEAV